MQGPALFLAQFLGDAAPFDTLDGICAWAAGLGFKAVQMPTTDGRFFNLRQAAESRSYCEDLQARLAQHGLVISELSTHLQGQLVAVHPAYAELFAGFAPVALTTERARRSWAVEQLGGRRRRARTWG